MCPRSAAQLWKVGKAEANKRADCLCLCCVASIGMHCRRLGILNMVWYLLFNTLMLQLTCVTAWMQVGPTATAGLAIAAVGAASFVFITGFETFLELLGFFGVIQFTAQRLLFAKDRQKTASDLRSPSLFLHRLACGHYLRKAAWARIVLCGQDVPL